ncbi:MAG: MFS transporter [Chloroflexi bacterium]|nr:MFS transporter [Chloroflexota bacterium]
MPSGKEKELPGTASRKPRYFYGWNIVAASFLSHLSYAEHFSSMLGFFFKPFQTEFGWSRSAVAAAMSIARVAEALVAPIIGPLVDRYGPRVLMPIGAVIVGFAMLGITQMTALWQFYLLRGVVSAIGFTIMGALVSDVAVNNWFVRKRGRALAISRLGSNISNVIFTPLTVFVLAASGWQTMFVIFAIVTWVAVLIPSAVLMRRRPEDMGLHPDGIQPSATETSIQKGEDTPVVDNASAPEPVWNRREVLKAGSFWLLALSLGINSMAFQGINISLAPYIQDLGYGEAMLATVMTFRAAMAAGALPFVGFLAEHADRLSVRVIPFIVQGIAVALLLLAEQPVFLWLGVALYGLGISAVTITQEVIWANYFGRLSLGVVRSMSFLVSFGFGAAGPIAINLAFDIMKSYRPAFIVIIVFFGLSAFVMGIVKPPKARRFATAAEMTR